MIVWEACKKSKILSVAKAESFEAFQRVGILRGYAKGEHLFLDRTEVGWVYFLVEGTAALYKLGLHQEKKVIFIIGGDEMMNEVILQDNVASINGEFLKNSLVLQFPKDDFLKIMENDFDLTRAILDSMALKIRRLYHQLKNTTNTMRLDKRIASKLWKLSRDCGVVCAEGIIIDFDLPITYLADMVGSTRETTSRQVRVLSDAGLICLRKGRFIVCDREKLLDYFRET